jgi:hypothetical protein
VGCEESPQLICAKALLHLLLLFWLYKLAIFIMIYVFAKIRGMLLDYHCQPQLLNVPSCAPGQPLS